MSAIANILLTAGEPAGIGPEIVVKVARRPQPLPLVVIGDPTLLEQTAHALNVPLEMRLLEADGESPSDQQSGVLNVIPVKLAQPVLPGTPNTENAHYVIRTLELATRLCLTGKYAAVVTGPVHKGIINDAGIPFSGHTEFFAARSHTAKVVMMLASGGLRVALATTHLPLKDVATAITRDSLRHVLSILIAELQSKFGLARPKILVAGLNPHAGEGGHLGREEIDIIAPVMRDFDSSAAELLGPLPADTLFTPHRLESADCVLAMYHDQGLPVLKHKGFGRAVNITLGLPFIRTSVDHGTALDLAGKGTADEGSLREAIAIASQLAAHRAQS